MSEMSPPTQEYYLPEELGLDSSKPEDLQLYVDSGGLRYVGGLLLNRRQLTRVFYAGDLDRPAYEQQIDEIDNQISDYRSMRLQA